MGVKGLWKLIEPVGRPINLETMEGKALAIDSSIWIYQFQATMRDKEGRGLVNAHVLGFLRRICKLLFYGIKPVFVFDGGAPPLKRATISERKRKKAGAAASHVQIAERLLAAQMRRQAVTDAEQRSTVQDPRRAPKGPVVVDDGTVYLEDLDNPQPASPPKALASAPKESPPSASKKKNKWIDYDPYRLPEVDENALSRAGSSTAPDPRLATEEELRQFIQEMKPSEFDITSPEFRALSTEVQYEIIGDLRLKSRQTSYSRVESMLRKSKTPMDFSMAQIRGLKQRNRLTQQLLTTTDSIGKAHIEIPIRIASERNREYVLVKNAGVEGGWVLGIRDNGTEINPIQIDQDPIFDENEDFARSDSDEEEMGSTVADQRPISLPFSSIGQRRPSESTTKPKLPSRRADILPLFVPEPGEIPPEHNNAEDEETDLQMAIQESLEEQEASQLRSAIEISKAEMTRSKEIPSTSGASSSRQFPSNLHGLTGDDNDDLVYTPLHRVPSRLDSVLTYANTTPKRSNWPKSTESVSPTVSPQSISFGKPLLLTQPTTPARTSGREAPIAISDSEDSMEEVEITKNEASIFPSRTSLPREIGHTPISQMAARPESDDDDDDMELIEVVQPAQSEREDNKHMEQEMSEMDEIQNTAIPPMQPEETQKREGASLATVLDDAPFPTVTSVYTAPRIEAPQTDRDSSPQPLPVTTLSSSGLRLAAPKSTAPPMEDSESEEDGWAVTHEEIGDTTIQAKADVDWDAAQEINVEEEAGEFANFASQVKGRELADVRKEIDEEIRALHQQRKVAMRDSEDVTQQMVSQIMVMLRLFGIPYMTAPMEAEAQCAELVQLGLVEGVITDDSDVFLFGGTRILKNLFNQSQTVEVFLASDLSRELELERDKLIRLAYLLGSDYVEGLPGVGPVIAMELIREFPGDGGLFKFREWWRQVQSGQDKSVTLSGFKRRFKKRFKDLFLPSEWPNPAVRDAYIHPAVDSSDEAFKWGMPDLDGLREFFRNELSWNQEKVDDLLLPIIRKMGQRSQANAMNKQGLLDPFLEKGSNGVISAPRKRDGYASKRLRQVVADFRKQKARQQSSGENQSEEEEAQPKQGKKKGKEAAPKRKREKKAPTRGRKRAVRSRSTSSEGEEKDSPVDEVQSQAIPDAPLSVKLRPRPKPKRLKPTVEADPEVEMSE